MNLIEIKNVYKQYKNGVTALSDVTVSIPKGDFVFVIGSTASGKSTLIKLLYRQEKPSRGEVYVGGVNVSKLKNRKVYKIRRKLGIVFQDYKLLPTLTVFENVAFALEIYGLPEKEVRKNIVKRDRLQSGICQGVLVVEAEMNSGTMHTVKYAEEQFKRIACYSHRLVKFSSGNEYLEQNKNVNILSDRQQLEEFIKIINLELTYTQLTLF